MMVTRSLGSRRSSTKMPDEHAAGQAFADPDRQVLVELGEAAGLQDVGQDVGGDFGIPLLDSAHAVGGEIGADKGHHQRHHAGGVEERAEQPERREAGGIHHDDFGIGRELVQRVRDRDHQRDRRDDQHQRRNHQAGDAEKGNDGLALARHQVDAAQRLRNPDHAGEADQDQRKRRKRRAENVLVDRPHRYRTIPPLRAQRAASDQPLLRGPLWSRRPPSSRLVSHYHPFDPSTKWPGRGTLRIWLIIHLMWPSGHAGAWQCGASQAIVPETGGLEAILGRCRCKNQKYPGPRPGDFLSAHSPEFWRIAYVRRRQGRLCSVFRSIARCSRGVLR